MKTILLKLSGDCFNNNDASATKRCIDNLANQIKILILEGFRIGIVIGGGNFFRGAKEGAKLGLKRPTADSVGMLATMMNGLMLQDFLVAAGIDAVVLNAFYTPQITLPITSAHIDETFKKPTGCLIFVGGTGNPFFSTDTNAVIRALQIGATELWKATNVDYLYDADPATHKESKPILTITHEEVIKRKLNVMDMTAITLAQEHQLPIKICNFLSEQALINLAHNKQFGSTIS